MKSVMRSLIAALFSFAAFWFIYWVPIAIALELAYGRFQWMWFVRLLGSVAAGAVAAQYSWRHKSWAPKGLVSCIILGGVVTGGVGFSAGWFGPMIFDPGSQGPVIGIVTGPMGFLLGSVCGAIYWAFWGRERRKVSVSGICSGNRIQ